MTLDRLKLIPRSVFIPYPEVERLALCHAYHLNVTDDLLPEALPILVDEIMQIIISVNPDLFQVHTLNFGRLLSQCETTGQGARKFQELVVLGLNRYINDIEMLRIGCREHADQYTTYEIQDNRKIAVVRVNPIFPTRDYEGILRREVQQAMEKGEFVPYKYLRVLGMC